MPRKSRDILNACCKAILPVDLLRRYTSLSIKFNRSLSTTLRSVLAATIDEAEAAGKKLYKFSPEEDQFDELARQVGEGAVSEDIQGASAGSQKENDGDAQHSAADADGEGVEVEEAGGGYADEGGGEPPTGKSGASRSKGR